MFEFFGVFFRNALSVRFWCVLDHIWGSFAVLFRIIFGTDFPVIDFGRAMDEIAGLDLKPEVLAKLLRHNAEKIYGLTG